MRLIDADALSQKWQDVLKEKADEKDSIAYQTFELFINRLKNEPTIEAEPVRHGEWIDKPTGAYRRMQSWCTACGKHSGIGGIESNRHKPYCPNCGAKMDGGAEDGK